MAACERAIGGKFKSARWCSRLDKRASPIASPPKHIARELAPFYGDAVVCERGSANERKSSDAAGNGNGGERERERTLSDESKCQMNYK